MHLKFTKTTYLLFSLLIISSLVLADLTSKYAASPPPAGSLTSAKAVLGASTSHPNTTTTKPLDSDNDRDNDTAAADQASMTSPVTPPAPQSPATNTPMGTTPPTGGAPAITTTSTTTTTGPTDDWPTYIVAVITRARRSLTAPVWRI